MLVDPDEIARKIARLLRMTNPDAPPTEEPRELILSAPGGSLGLASAPWAECYVVALFISPKDEEPRFSAIMHADGSVQVLRYEPGPWCTALALLVQQLSSGSRWLAPTSATVLTSFSHAWFIAAFLPLSPRLESAIRAVRDTGIGRASWQKAQEAGFGPPGERCRARHGCPGGR
jgi:hypothetical protein